MSTRNTPIAQLTREAETAASHLFTSWTVLPRKNPDICKVCIAMDDGLRIVEFPWKDLKTMSKAEMVKKILSAMSEPAIGES